MFKSVQNSYLTIALFPESEWNFSYTSAIFLSAPGLVKQLSYRIIGWHRADQTVDVSLQWMAPKYSSDHNRILSYTIQWKKMPVLHSILSVEPHVNETKVPGVRLVYCKYVKLQSNSEVGYGSVVRCEIRF